MTRASEKRHWTREPMVWMVIAIPLISVLMGVTMITIAVRNHDGLVVDDYYKRGLEINEVLAREARAGELALAAEVQFEPSSNRVSVSLSGRPAFQAPDEIQLGFYHATRKAEDRVMSLRRDAHGVYTAPMPNLPPGRWYVSAETPDWRLKRAVVFPEPGGFRITAETTAADPSRT